MPKYWFLAIGFLLLLSHNASAVTIAFRDNVDENIVPIITRDVDQQGRTLESGTILTLPGGMLPAGGVPGAPISEIFQGNPEATQIYAVILQNFFTRAISPTEDHEIPAYLRSVLFILGGPGGSATSNSVQFRQYATSTSEFGAGDKDLVILFCSGEGCDAPHPIRDPVNEFIEGGGICPNPKPDRSCCHP